ncbi:hypothetical protein LTR37_002244 [Vermiconidia calcicola]|uniref:Uncharacterized protein n=1 Tax=Vermiconidia calcicola TaxID=1690605 RepID=A0ACC3NUX2_9PEZI|nr:hypothetical protein LTR37_002244 [Vermiconidia calcicola]
MKFTRLEFKDGPLPQPFNPFATTDLHAVGSIVVKVSHRWQFDSCEEGTKAAESMPKVFETGPVWRQAIKGKHVSHCMPLSDVEELDSAPSQMLNLFGSNESYAGSFVFHYRSRECLEKDSILPRQLSAAELRELELNCPPDRMKRHQSVQLVERNRQRELEKLYVIAKDDPPSIHSPSHRGVSVAAAIDTPQAAKPLRIDLFDYEPLKTALPSKRRVGLAMPSTPQPAQPEQPISERKRTESAYDELYNITPPPGRRVATVIDKPELAESDKDAPHETISPSTTRVSLAVDTPQPDKSDNRG